MLKTILTLRRDRGGLYHPPLEYFFILLQNGAPQARHVLHQLLNISYGHFDTIPHPPAASGGLVPPSRRRATPMTVSYTHLTLPTILRV